MVVFRLHKRTGTFRLGGWGGDFHARKNYEMPERVRAEIGMQTQTFTIFPSNETAIIGKIAQLKVFPLTFCTNKALIRAFFFYQALDPSSLPSGNGV